MFHLAKTNVSLALLLHLYVASQLNANPKAVVLKNKKQEKSYAHEAYKLDEKYDSLFSFDHPKPLEIITTHNNDDRQYQTPGMLGLGVLGEKDSGGFTIINISSEADNSTKYNVEAIKPDDPNAIINRSYSDKDPNHYHP
ncbi:MAG: hypothetical protein LBB20_02445 [Puniceicoccales bacterium]|jgi:hypothetical protein|nr:hypothetical protein [Puniceicoccales bacterium]